MQNGQWFGARLPHEFEWEWAARGGTNTLFPWGNKLSTQNGPQANFWIGQFPWLNERRSEGPYTTVPGTFPANGYGLFDMIGNAWEWTDSLRESQPGKTVGGQLSVSSTLFFATKGGSFLCADNNCQRFRPTARMYQRGDHTASNLGFRVAISV